MGERAFWEGGVIFHSQNGIFFHRQYFPLDSGAQRLIMEGGCDRGAGLFYLQFWLVLNWKKVKVAE